MNIISSVLSEKRKRKPRRTTQRDPPNSRRRRLIEKLEERHLLAVTPLSFDETAALGGTVSSIESFGDRLGEIGAFRQSLPMMEASLGQQIDLGGVFRDSFAAPIQSYLDTASATEEGITASVSTTIANLGHLSGTITPIISESEINFTVDGTFERTLDKTFDLSTLFPESEIRIADQLDAELKLTLDFNITFGIDRTATTATAGAFVSFNDDPNENKLSAELSFDPQFTPLQANVGILGVSLEDPTASLSLMASFDTTSARVTPAELSAGDLSSLIGITTPNAPQNEFNFEMNVGTSLAGVDVAGAKVSITDDNLFDSNAPTISVDVGELTSFRALSPTGLLSALNQAGSTLGSLPAFETEIPFTGGNKLSETVDLGKAIGAKVIQPASASAEPGTTPTVLEADAKEEGSPGFTTLQEFAALVNANVEFVVPPDAINEIVLDFSFTHNFDVATFEMDFGDGLGDLSEFDLDASTRLNVNAGVDVDFQVGLKLTQPGASFGLDDNTLLSDLLGGSGVPSVAGQSDFKVTLRNGQSKEIDLTAVLTVGQLKTELSTGNLSALQVGYQTATDPITGGEFNEGISLIDPTTGTENSTLKIEMLNSSLAAASLGLVGLGATGIFIGEDGNLDEVTHGMMTGAIHGQSIADNLYFKQRLENNIALPMFSAGVELTAEIDGSVQLGFLELGINDASAVGLVSVDFTPPDPNASGDITASEIVELGGSLGKESVAPKAVDFDQPTDYSGNVEIVFEKTDDTTPTLSIPFTVPAASDADDIEALARAMNESLAASSDPNAARVRVGSVMGMLAFTLTSRTDIRKMTVKGGGANQNVVMLGLTEDTSVYVLRPQINGSAHFDIPYSLGVSLGGLTLPGEQRFEFDVPDLFHIDLSLQDALDIDLTGIGDQLNRLKDLDAGDILDAIKGAFDLLNGLDGFGDAAFLNEPLPLLGTDLKSVLDLGGTFGELVTGLEASPVTAIGLIDDHLESLLGISNDDAVQLSLDTSGDNPALRIDLLVSVGEGGFGFGSVAPLHFETPVSIDLAELGSTEFSNLIDAKGSAALTLDGLAELNVSLGIELPEIGDPIPFLYDYDDTSDTGTNLSLLVKADASDIHFDVAIGPIGASVVQQPGQSLAFAGTAGPGNEYARFAIELTDLAAGDDGRHLLGELALTGPNALSLDDFDFAGDGSLTFDAELDFAGLPTFPVAFALNDIGDLTQPGGLQPADFSFTINNTTADEALGSVKDILAGDFDLLSFVGGWDGAFDLLIEAMEGEVFGLELPFVGDKLKDQANFLRDIKDSVSANLGDNVQNEEGGVFTEIFDDIRQDILDGVGPGGINLLKDLTNDGEITIDDIVIGLVEPGPGVEFEILLGSDLGKLDLPIDFDLGIPGLGLDIDADVEASLGFEFGLSMGVDLDHGFFIDTTGSFLEVFVDVQIPNLNAAGELGFLRLDANLLADQGEQARAMALVGADQDASSQFEIYSVGRGSGSNFDVRIVPDDGQGDSFVFNTTDRSVTLEVTATTTAQDLVELITNEPALSAHLTAQVVGDGTGVVDANQRALGVSNSFVGQFSVDLIDPALDGPADGLLSFNEIVAVDSFKDVVDVNVLAKAALDMQLHAGFGVTANFPSIETGLSVDWEFQLGESVMLPTVQFVDIQLGLGEFLSGFAGGLFEQVEKVLEPVRPIIAFLNEPLPVVSELTGGSVTVLDLIRLQGGGVARAVAFIEAVQKLDNIISNIPDLGDAMLPIGNATYDPNKAADGFTIDGGLTDAFAAMTSAFSSTAPASGGFDPNNFLMSDDDLADMGDDKLKLGFPILSPASILKLLGGEVTELFTLELPTLTLEKSISKFFPLPVFPAVGVELAGIFEAKADFAFGFDTLGIEQFKQSGDFEDVINGFYVFDHENADGTGEDIPEVVLSAGITAAAALNAGILKASVGGGIFANVDFNLYDGDDDGKIRLVELLDSVLLGPIHVFDVSGSFDAKLFATVTIDLGFFDIDKKFDLAEINLFKFDLPRPHGSAAPLAELQGSNLVLNIGDRATQRDPTGLLGIGDEQAVDYRIFAGPQPGDILVESFGRSQLYQNVTQITGTAGRFDDTIIVGDQVTVPVTLDGGDGNDRLIGGAGINVLSGGLGNDDLRGRAARDILTGGPGRDNLLGEGGNDDLSGGDDADTLFGGDGDDIIRGEEGNDEINGGSGDDDLIGGPGLDRIFGDGGGDTIDGGTGADEIQGGDGGDFILGGDGDDQIFAGPGNDVVRAGTGNDIVRGGVGSDTLFGEADDDQLFGENSRDVIYGGPGNDLLEGGLASDELFGGIGDDELFANTRDTNIVDEAGHLLVGGGGDDFITAAFPSCDINTFDCSFDNTVFGDGVNDELGSVDPTLDGDDVIHTGDGNDTIAAGGGNDQVYASLGIELTAADIDWVDAGTGDDVVFTGHGNDYVIGGFGDDELFGQAGSDVIWGGLAPEGITAADFNRGDNEDATVIELHFELPPRYEQAESSYPTGYVPPLITPKFVLGSSIDGIEGDGRDKIEGGIGIDFLFGGAGVDVILGGADSDYIDAGTGHDINVRGGDGDDIVRGGGNNDVLNGDAGIDQILGDGGDDKLYGDSGTAGVQLGQRLFGGDGGDILHAYADGIHQNGSQNALDGDQLFGDAEGDTLYGSLRREWLFGGAGKDLLIGDYLRGSDYRINTAADTTGADDKMFGGSGEDKLFGGGGNDEMWGGGDSDYFDGQAGDDTQYGGSGNDLFVVSAMRLGQEGVDVIDGHYGNAIEGDSLDDSTDVLVINGSQNHDIIGLSQEKPGTGNRLRIDYESGALASRPIYVNWLNSAGQPLVEQFQIAGLAGNDVIGFAGVHPNLLPLEEPSVSEPLDLSLLVSRSSEAVSTIEGNSGNDTVIGSIAGDLINGGPGSDTLYGFAGDDSLTGDNLDGFIGDHDVMFAGQGNDDLIGGQGSNEMYAWSLRPYLGTLADFKTNGPDSSFGVFIDESGMVLGTDLNGNGNLDALNGLGQPVDILDADNQPIPAARLEFTGLNRLLGGERNDDLFGGTILDFMLGRGGNNTLYRVDGSTFESLGGAIPGDEWKEYAKDTGQVWYVGGTNADDEISVNFVTEPGLLSDHHLITRLTDNNGNFTFDAQVRLDFAATDADGNLIWSPQQLAFDYQALRDAQDAVDPESEISAALERSAESARENLINNLLPPEGDFLAIIVDALDGNDKIIVGPTVQKSVWIDAGAGDDEVTIRGGNAILADRAESGEIAGLRGNNDAPERAFSLTLPAGAPVSGASNTSPIVITTSDTSGLLNGQDVTIAGVGSNTAANGSFFAKVLSPTTFELYSNVSLTIPVAGNSDFTSGGSWTTSVWRALDGKAANVDGLEFNGLTIDNVSDVDWFAFELAATSVAGAEIQLVSGSPVDELNLEIYEQGTDTSDLANRINAGSFATTGEKSSISIASNLVVGTTYLLKVSSPNVVPTIYDLRINLSGTEDLSALVEIPAVELGVRSDAVRRDLILGGPGDDKLLGGPGKDWILGGPGNDVISGGLDRMASDLLLGEEGDDTFQIIPDELPRVGNQPESLFDPVTQKYRPTANDIIDGGVGEDRMLYVGGDLDRRGFAVPDFAAIRYNTQLHRYEFSSLVWDIGEQQFTPDTDPTSGNDYLRQYLFYQTKNVEGTQAILGQGDDSFHADPSYQFPGSAVPEEWGISLGDFQQSAVAASLNIAGGFGNDELFGGALADTISGGPGNDLIMGAQGDDELSGDGGNDVIYGLDGSAAVRSPGDVVAQASFGFSEPYRYSLVAPFFAMPEAGRPGVDLNALRPVAHYSFDRSSDIGDDGSGRGHDLTASNVTWSSDGISGGSAQFTGQSSVLTIGSTGVDLGETWTVSAWFKGLVDSNNWNALFRGIQNDYQVIVQANSDDLGSFSTSQGLGFIDSGIDLSREDLGDGWHQITAVGAADSTRVYVDGLLAGEMNAQVSNVVHAIGNRVEASQQFADQLDEVYLYDTALTAQQVAEHFETSQQVTSTLQADAFGLEGVLPSEHLSELRSIGDFNGDGRDDFIASSDTTSYILLGPVELDALERIDVYAEIVVDHVAVGRPAQSFGNVNGDESGIGYADLAFVRDDDGDKIVTVVLGGPTMAVSEPWQRHWDESFVNTYVNATGATRFRTISLHGSSISDTASIEVHLLEMTGDDLDDLVVVAESSGPESIVSGFHDLGFVFSGSDITAFVASVQEPHLGLVDRVALIRSEGVQTVSKSFATGDFNGDGVEDLLFGNTGLTVELATVSPAVLLAATTPITTNSRVNLSVILNQTAAELAIDFGKSESQTTQAYVTKINDLLLQSPLSGKVLASTVAGRVQIASVDGGADVRLTIHGAAPLGFPDTDREEEFTQNNPFLNISSGAPAQYFSDITPFTNDLFGTIVSVNPFLQLTHTYAADLAVTLINPDLKRVKLFSNEGGADDFVSTNRLLFDDVGGPFSLAGGVIRPEEPLTKFRNDLFASNLPWQLEILDEVALDGGSLDQWGLVIRTTQNSAVGTEQPISEAGSLLTGLNGEHVFRANVLSRSAEGVVAEPIALGDLDDDGYDDFGLLSGTDELTVYSGAAETTAIFGGTQLVADIAPFSSSFPEDLTVFNGVLYFSAQGELWRYDGTSESLVSDINPNGGESVSGLKVFNDALYFSANDGTSGNDLWRYDGSGVPQHVADINPPGSFTGGPTDLTVFNGELYFRAGGDANARRLWKYDGNVATQLSALDVGNNANTLTVYDNGSVNALYFAADDGLSGEELWRYTSNGVLELAADINSGSAPSFPSDMTVFGNDLLFEAFDTNNGRELWKYNGIVATRVSDINPQSGNASPRSLTVFDNSLYFGANDGTSRFLYKYDGSNISTVDSTNDFTSIPQHMLVFDDMLYFVGESAATGNELWRSDGVTNTNVTDIRLGSLGAQVSELAAFNDTLFFSANDGESGVELWGYASSGLSVLTSVVGNNLSASDLSASAGDFNADGARDLVITQTPGIDQGSVHVFNSVATLGSSLDLAEANVVFPYQGHRASGRSIDGFDLNNDGIDDLVIGAGLADNEDGITDVGRIYTVYGARVQTVLPENGVFDLENFSVPGSGSFVVDPLTGRPDVFNNAGEPFEIAAATEKWFRFSTLGDGKSGDYIQLFEETLSGDNGLKADLINSEGGVLQFGQRAFDLRTVQAGQYFLRVQATQLTQFTIELNAPAFNQTHETTTLPDRDLIRGGDGDDTIYGNNDIDRIFSGSGVDTVIAEPIEIRDGSPGDSFSDPQTDELISNDTYQPLDPEVTLPVAAFVVDSSQWNLNGNLDNRLQGAAPLTVAGSQPVTFETSIINGQPAQVANVPKFTSSSNQIRGINPIGPNGGATDTNEYTLVLDVNLKTFQTAWNAILQTNPSNSNDAEFAIRSNGQVDYGNVNAGNLSADTWYRLGFVNEVVNARIMTSLFVDGVQVGQTADNGPIDGRYSLETEFLLFSDDTNETGNFLVNNVALFGYPLDGDEILALGGPKAVSIDRSNLTEAVARQLGRPFTTDTQGRPRFDNRFHASELGAITSLDASGFGLTSLDGIEFMPRLEHLDLSNNPLGDSANALAPLANLSGLVSLDLSGNANLTDIQALSELASLRELYLDGTGVGIDPTVVSSLDQLEVLTLPVSGLQDRQNLTGKQGTQVTIGTATSGTWTVANPAGTTIASSTVSGTSITFTPTDAGVYTISLQTVGSFPFIAQNLAPEILNLPATIALNQGDTRSDDQLLASPFVIDDAGTTTRQVTVRERATGIVTDLTTGSLSLEDDVVELDSGILDGATDVTIAFWMRTETTGFRSILSAANQGQDDELFIATYGTLRIIEVRQRTASLQYFSPTAFNDNNWHHVAVVRESETDTVSVFLDGTLLSARPASLHPLNVDEGGLIVGQEQDSVGGGFQSSQAFDGNLDELAIWRRALHADQIEDVVGMGVLGLGVAGLGGVGNESDLALYLPLNELGGDIAHDRSPNRRHGIVRSVDTATDIAWSTDSGVADQDFRAITPGDYDLVVIAHDADGASDRAEALIVVSNAAPTARITPGADFTATVGQTVALNALGDGLPSTDPGDDEMTFSWTVTTSNLPEPGAAAPAVTGEAFGFVPSVSGPHTVTLSATDVYGDASMDTVTVNVNPVAPLLSSRSGLEGDVFLFDAAGESAKASDTVRTYSWQVFQGATVIDTGNQFDFAFNPSDNGAFTVELTITDTINSMDFVSAASTATLTAANADPTIDTGMGSVGFEGTPVTLGPIVADAGSSDTLTYSWIVRDSANQLATLDTADDLPSVTFTPPDNGVYTATLTVLDDDGGSTFSSTTIDVANVAPMVSVIRPLLDVEPNNTRATAQNLDLAAWSLDFNPQVELSVSLAHLSIAGTGDGTLDYYSLFASPGDRLIFDIDANSFDTELFLFGPNGVELALSDDNVGPTDNDPTFLASYIDYTIPSSGLEGIYTIGVAAFNSSSANGEIVPATTGDDISIPNGATYTLNVSAAKPPVDVRIFETQNGNEIQFNGSFTDAGAADTNSTFVWDFGDGTTNDTSLTPTHAYSDSGLYTVTLTVTDKDGGVGTHQVLVDLGNLDPQTLVLGQPAQAMENTTVAFGGSVRDFDGMLHSDIDLEPLRGRIDFGDGVALPVLLRNPTRDGGFADYTFESRHIYTAPGNYNVTVTIQDDDGGIVTNTTTIEISPSETAGFDFGDAPDTYQTLNASGGPQHVATGPRLGALRDSEMDGLPSADASGDDNGSSDDEDGVMFGDLGVGMTMAGVNIDLQNAASAFVDAWVDFDGDGIFQSDEQILTSAVVNNVGGPQTLNYVPNDDAIAGDTLARIRVSSTGGLSVGGAADDGEVEDYQVTILPRLGVESVVVNDGDSQRSTLTNVVVTFSREVDVTESAFEIRDRDSGTVLESLNVSASVNAMGQTEARLTFGQNGNLAEPGTSGQTTLIDGNYVLTIRSLLDDPAGVGLPLASDVEFGAQEVDGFFRFFGDSDGDRDVDGQDYGRFGLTFLKSIGDPQYNSDFDSDADGDVDGQDYGRFGLRFLKTLPF